MRIDRSYVQSTSLRKAEQTEAKSPTVAQTPSEASETVSTPVKSSINTWQQAGLVQDGSIKQSMLNHELSVAQSYGQLKAEAERAKDAKESSASSFLGSIFGGPIIGTFIGNAIPEVSNKETTENPLRTLIETMQNEVKKISEQLEGVYNNSFIDTSDDFSGVEKRSINLTPYISKSDDDDD